MPPSIARLCFGRDSPSARSIVEAPSSRRFAQRALGSPGTGARLTLATVLALAETNAHAHRAAPAAVSVIAADEAGPSIVRLTSGLAVRVGTGFRYVCPSAWGGDSSLAEGAVGGPAVVGGAGGQLGVAQAGSPIESPEESAFPPSTRSKSASGCRSGGAGNGWIRAETALGVFLLLCARRAQCMAPKNASRSKRSHT